MNIADFYRDKKVFITGHTGFKGAWMCKVLQDFGAQVCGYSLEPPTKPSLFVLADVAAGMQSELGDVRSFEDISGCLRRFTPDIVIHMAAQPLVRESYENPVYTYEVNVMGTVNLLEAVRGCPRVSSVLNVTTDKVYQNNEWVWGYRETDRLDGYDPYSNSKSCSELLTGSYKRAFFQSGETAVSTCRAGNVIGGGDFANDRIIPDCVRAIQNNASVYLRNPHSVRPYQHVLEPIFTYLMIAARQVEDHSLEGCYNVGPDEESCVTTQTLVSTFCELWGESARWCTKDDVGAPHEAGLLKLDCARLKSVFGWRPVWDIRTSLLHTAEGYKQLLSGEDIRSCMERQIRQFAKDFA